MVVRRNRLISGFLVLTMPVVLASPSWTADKNWGKGETQILDKLIHVRTDQILAQPLDDAEHDAGQEEHGDADQDEEELPGEPEGRPNRGACHAGEAGLGGHVAIEARGRARGGQVDLPSSVAQPATRF